MSGAWDGPLRPISAAWCAWLERQPARRRQEELVPELLQEPEMDPAAKTPAATRPQPLHQ